MGDSPHGCYRLQTDLAMVTWAFTSHSDVWLIFTFCQSRFCPEPIRLSPCPGARSGAFLSRRSTTKPRERSSPGRLTWLKRIMSFNRSWRVTSSLPGPFIVRMVCGWCHMTPLCGDCSPVTAEAETLPKLWSQVNNCAVNIYWSCPWKKKSHSWIISPSCQKAFPVLKKQPL